MTGGSVAVARVEPPKRWAMRADPFERGQRFIQAGIVEIDHQANAALVDVPVADGGKRERRQARLLVEPPDMRLDVPRLDDTRSGHDMASLVETMVEACKGSTESVDDGLAPLQNTRKWGADNSVLNIRRHQIGQP